MKTEEKLQHFLDISERDARTEAQELVESCQEELEQNFNSFKEEKDLEAENAINAENSRSTREINRRLSTSQMDIKRQETKKQEELKGRLFQEVKEKLLAFIKTPEYENYLKEKIEGAIDFAGDDEIRIYLSSGDKDLIPALAADTGAALEISNRNFIGGMMAVIEKKNILIDDSFLSAFEQERESFTFDRGQTNE